MLQQLSFGGVSVISFCARCGKPLSNPTSVQAGMGPICRGHRDQGESNIKNQDKHIDMRKWGERFDYKGFNGCDCHCYIKRNGNVILCTESPENEGTSITNMAEWIATLVCKEYGIRFEDLLWIEHYVNLSATFADEVDGETFDFVTFQVEGDHLAHPQWKHLGRAGASFYFDLPIKEGTK